MNKIFYLDLHKNELLGWEREKSRLVIKAMIKNVKKGDKFPPVPVKRIGDNRYILCSDIQREDNINQCDGGHHRAIAHYRAGKPLRCRLIGEDGYNYPMYTPIRKIKLVRRGKDSFIIESSPFE